MEGGLVSTRPFTLKALLQSMRPRQWTKNGLLLVPLAFTLSLDNPALVSRSLVALVLFCALSSAGYLVNDVADLESDRQHPLKRNRPIASGAVPVPAALGLGGLLAGVGVLGCFLLSPMLGVLAIAYLLLTATYTVWLKHQVLLDVFGLAAGFVLRAAAGAVAIDVPVSPWLYTATLLGALLIGLGKRRSELKALGPDDAVRVRKNLQAYSIPFIDQLILVVSSSALMTYALYTFSAENLPRNHSMMLTIPVVLYGLFRYLYLVHEGAVAGAPEDLLFRDRPLLAAVVTWAIMAVAILYIGSRG